MGRNATSPSRGSAWCVSGALAIAWLAPAPTVAAEQRMTPPLPAIRPARALLGQVPLPPSRPALPVLAPGSAPLPVSGQTAAPAPIASPATDAASPGSAPPSPPDASVEQLNCARLFAGRKVVARGQPSLSGADGCGIAAPVSVSAVVVSPASSIAIRPPIEVNCAMAEAFADWVREDLVPVFSKIGTPLAGLSDSSGYQCRGRNRVVGAKLSEHARGNAIDIGRFSLADGHDVSVVDDGRSTGVLAEVKRTACARFTTVLGPGSDGFHETHMHIDLAFRRGHGRFCHWDRT